MLRRVPWLVHSYIRLELLLFSLIRMNGNCIRATLCLNKLDMHLIHVEVGDSFCENARRPVHFSFIFRRTYRLRHSFHAILDLVWVGPAKSDIFVSQPHTPTDLRSFNHTFFFSFQSICHPPSAVCLESLVEIRSAVLEKSPVKAERRAQVRE